MEEKVTEVLKSIGLKESEVNVYLDLIKNGESSALEISKRIKIYRTNVYDTLGRLLQKGFIREMVNENRRMFEPINPAKIKDYMHQKEKEVENIIPKIQNLYLQKQDEESVSMSKGVFALREALSDLLKHEKTIYVYGAPKKAVDLFGEGFLEEFHKERISKQINMLHIYNQHAQNRIDKLNKMEYTEAKYLEKEYDYAATTVICEDTVLMIVFGNRPSVIKIKNKDIAQSYSRYFEIVWGSAITGK